jgi:hypothetical protein
MTTAYGEHPPDLDRVSSGYPVAYEEKRGGSKSKSMIKSKKQPEDATQGSGRLLIMIMLLLLLTPQRP